MKQEKWWQTTIQVAIPFFIAGIGTIGAGIILGHVEVSWLRETIQLVKIILVLKSWSTNLNCRFSTNDFFAKVTQRDMNKAADKSITK